MAIAFNLSSKQLRRAALLRERIEKLEQQLGAILTPASEGPEQGAAKVVKPPRRKRKMSAAGKLAISKAAKARWAKIKAAGKKSP